MNLSKDLKKFDFIQVEDKVIEQPMKYIEGFINHIYTLIGLFFYHEEPHFLTLFPRQEHSRSEFIRRSKEIHLHSN